MLPSSCDLWFTKYISLAIENPTHEKEGYNNTVKIILFQKLN